MTEDQFEFDLGRYGGDLARWPADRRAEAEALIARSPAAARQHREALALDRLLAPPPLSRADAMVPESLVTRITSLAQEPASAPQPATSQRRVMLLRYAACVAAALAGIGVGALQSRDARVSYEVLDLAFGAPAGDFDVQ